jgi:hypothetical protein
VAPVRQSLADVLLEERLIDEEDLRSAGRRARREGVSLVVALVEAGRVSEASVLDVAERRLKLPRADLSSLFVEQDAVREVTYNLAAAHCLLPLALERQAGRRVIRVAMADPLDAEALEEMESSTGCHVEAMVAAPSELGPAIEKAYRGIVTKVLHRSEAAERPQPAETTTPHKAIEDLAPTDLRLRALVQLLVDKGVISDEEYRERVRALVGHDGEGS